MLFSTAWKRVRQTFLRRSITLIEMIVVMILIATITGALAYNYRESLNEGKAFKTREGISRIETILTIFFAENPDAHLDNNWEDIIRSSSLVKDPDKFLRDGWGEKYDIQVIKDPNTGDVHISVVSKEYEQYKKRKGISS